MKSIALLFVRLTFTALLLSFCTSVFAQKVATWKGGTPGRNTDWYCAANWADGRVPNEFSQVIIPDVSASTFSYPVLGSGEVEIWSLQMLAGAQLKIGKKAHLIVSEQEDNGSLAWGEGVIHMGMLPKSLAFASK